MVKKANNFILKFLLFSFIFFLVIYFANETGYYEYKIYTKTKLTEESIKNFEEDIKNNKNTSQKDYIIEEYQDYSNKLTKTGSKIGSFIEKMIHKTIKKSLEILSDLFYK